MLLRSLLSPFFFLNDAAPTEFYPLPLPPPLPTPPPVLPPGTTRKLPLANSTVSPLPSALYTPAFRYWFTSARPSPPLKVSVVPLENPCTSTVPAFNSPACHTTWPCAKDRKSTRLNSSHLVISYAVFCLTTQNL